MTEPEAISLGDDLTPDRTRAQFSHVVVISQGHSRVILTADQMEDLAFAWQAHKTKTQPKIAEVRHVYFEGFHQVPGRSSYQTWTDVAPEGQEPRTMGRLAWRLAAKKEKFRLKFHREKAEAESAAALQSPAGD